MSSAEFRAQLAALEDSSASQSSSQADRVSTFTILLHHILSLSLAKGLAGNLKAFVETLLSDNINIITSRPVLAEFVKVIGKLENVAIKKDVFISTLEKLQPKSVSFEERDCNIREALADIYEAGEENGEAAKVLAGIQLQPNQRQILDDFRISILFPRRGTGSTKEERSSRTLKFPKYVRKRAQATTHMPACETSFNVF